MKCQFAEVHYYHRKYKAKPITKRINVLGFDSESYDNGVPFLFCISDGSIIRPEHLFETLFQHKYRNVKFMCFNIKYDEGSILHLLPNHYLDEIRKTGKTEYNGLRFRSIPRKELTITDIQSKHSVSFYDIAQFYGTSLDNASLYYLGKTKIEMPTKTFTKQFVNDHFNDIASYCINDAKLTCELANYFIDMLINEFEVYPQKLYSTGYISGIHFSRVCEVIDVNRLWNYHRECLEYAFNSYAGGKFETYKRGFGNFYQYDINSAYPYEIANLKTIKGAKIVKRTTHDVTADYAFIKCNLTIGNDYSPIPLKVENVNRYPCGYFTKTITKNEYEYLNQRGDSIEIIDGYYIYCKDEYPYKTEINRLFELKRQYKYNDKLRYMLVKILLNSFYGKFIQITPKYRNGEIIFDAGYLFNPIYASVITANTRLKLSRMCDNFDSIVSVHTDSVISSKELAIPLSDKLGEWNLEANGYGVSVGCGVYQVGNKVHYRGYKRIDSLIDLIMNNRNKIKIPVNQTLVLSWRLIVFRNAENDMINRFVNEDKILNLHFDSKRNWSSAWKWDNKLHDSEPYFIVAP